MLNDENKELCWRVLAKYGIRAQRIVVMEECSELQKAICKMFRETTNQNVNNYHEEIVDVIVMCQQMLLADRISMEEVNKMAKAKLERALK